MLCPPKFSMAQIHSENENWEAICCKLWNQSSVDQRPCHPAAKGHLKQSSSIIAWEKVCWRTGSPKVQLSTMYFSALIFTLSPQPPCHETPSPSLSAQPWGVEKLLFPRTKYSNNKVQQRWKTITLKNLKCIQASGLWYANNKLQQRTIVDLLSQATFCLLTKKTEKTTIWRLFNVVLINLFTNLYLRLPDGPGWSPRLNLYWWPSTHPLARALTLHYPEFLGIR